MLTLTILTMTYSSHAETDNFDHNPFQSCWYGRFWPWHNPDMMKLTIWTMAHSRHAETDIFYRYTFKTYWNWHFLPLHVQDILKLLLLTDKLEAGFFVVFVVCTTTTANIYPFLESSSKAVLTLPGLRTIQWLFFFCQIHKKCFFRKWATFCHKHTFFFG
jgi:hypothetical protein